MDACEKRATACLVMATQNAGTMGALPLRSGEVARPSITGSILASAWGGLLRRQVPGLVPRRRSRVDELPGA